MNVYDFQFDSSDLAFIDDRQANGLAHVEVQQKDILLNITGASVARCCMAPTDTLPARVNQHVAIVRVDPHRADAECVLYAINSPQYKKHLLTLAQGGATREALTKQTIEDFGLKLPPLFVQRRIAAILSAYDDLILNNTRRIQLLEQMARAIYEEWFVKFRFPGHGKVKMVKSELGPIPEGWEVRPFSEVADFVNGFAFKPSHWGKVGKPIVKIVELKDGVTDRTPRYDGDDIPEKYYVGNGDVLFSWSADLDAYIWSHGEALLNQHLFNVIPRQAHAKYFIYWALKQHMERFRSRSLGTTMRHIKRAALDQVNTVVPGGEMIKSFDALVSPVVEEVLNLTSKNSNLLRTRDLLLPKLISGEIDVSELDVKTEMPA